MVNHTFKYHKSCTIGIRILENVIKWLIRLMSVYFFLTGRSNPISWQKGIRQVVFKKKKKFEIDKKRNIFPYALVTLQKHKGTL